MFEHFSAPLHEKLECAREYGIGRRPAVILSAIELAGHTAGVHGPGSDLLGNDHATAIVESPLPSNLRCPAAAGAARWKIRDRARVSEPCRAVEQGTL
jgi:hypothetical protein